MGYAAELQDTDLVEMIAEALYETDEDLIDEAASARAAAGDTGLMRARRARVRWMHVSLTCKQVYLRRARAARAAIDAPASLERLENLLGC